MSLPNNQTEPVEPKDPAVDPIDTTTEPAEPKEGAELTFDDLDDDTKKLVDRERTKASKTAREKAMREAKDDPDIRKAIRAELEAEAKLSAEERVEKTLKEISLRENRLDAREKLVTAGLVGDALSEMLEILVTADREGTIARVDKFLEVYNTSVASTVDTKLRENVKNTPKPRPSSTVTKKFSEMSFDERVALKETDPKRYEEELKKSKSSI